MDRTAGDRHQPNIISESRGSLAPDKVDYALKVGLAKHKNKLTYYKKVVAHPTRFAQDPVLRQYGGELLDTLLHLVFDDGVMWNRMKVLLTRTRARGLREDISDQGLRSLIDKSVQKEVPLEVVLEVYSRGASQGGENEGFARVNSFIAGGRARTLDSDLLAEEAPAPAAAPERTNKTLTMVKRVLKEKAR
jgi:hypothetical protein